MYAPIREALRRIIDEPIARHYYIDGSNCEPQRIGLRANALRREHWF